MGKSFLHFCQNAIFCWEGMTGDNPPKHFLKRKHLVNQYMYGPIHKIVLCQLHTHTHILYTTYLYAPFHLSHLQGTYISPSQWKVSFLWFMYRY